MRLVALIIFSIEWRQMELILRGRQPKYWWQKFSKKTKKMRLVALIIFSIEWRQMELILRGKQSKYWWQKISKKQNGRCVVILGFQKIRFPRSLLFRRDPTTIITTMAVSPRGSGKRKSSNDDEALAPGS